MSRLLTTKSVAKPWGQDRLPPPFTAPAGERIGEIWFEPPPELPQLLVKYLFTSEKLSVQVHPSDAQAPAGSRGKEECWLVLTAEPGAQLGVGFRHEVSPGEMRKAALDGTIEQMLEWRDVQPGDFVYLTAGTVHAIGAGLSLIEVQQNSDITYRLYDYGRPRELHLDEAVAVAHGRPHDASLRRHLPKRGEVSLVEGPHFRLDRLDGAPGDAAMARYDDRPLLVIPVDAPVTLGGETVPPGGCALADNLAAVRFGEGGTLIAQPVEQAA
ncbi:mannose-6-phosphate isomerase [Tsuneonella deserti]|uniref:Mannose-6-phosphate isomerase n=1 Tax=Tsuneonella deserti TaxID=2035528 RepID=A0ABQ1S1J5_9SPHN|nr:class I mannose-6-phosphate isomerase [Tsuneonella deserti]GGD86532.1 mannose-6-phosphate isomerase [Tsuneonella deserti]